MFAAKMADQTKILSSIIVVHCNRLTATPTQMLFSERSSVQNESLSNEFLSLACSYEHICEIEITHFLLNYTANRTNPTVKT